MIVGVKEISVSTLRLFTFRERKRRAMIGSSESSGMRFSASVSFFCSVPPKTTVPPLGTRRSAKIDEVIWFGICVPVGEVETPFCCEIVNGINILIVLSPFTRGVAVRIVGIVSAVGVYVVTWPAPAIWLVFGRKTYETETVVMVAGTLFSVVTVAELMTVALLLLR